MFWSWQWDSLVLPDEIKRDGLSDETLEKYRKVVRNRWIRAVIIHIGLLSALIAYSFIGAAIFQVYMIHWYRTTYILVIADMPWATMTLCRDCLELWVKLARVYIDNWHIQLLCPCLLAAAINGDKKAAKILKQWVVFKWPRFCIMGRFQEEVVATVLLHYPSV